jgi:cytochrome c oxidase subunit 3
MAVGNTTDEQLARELLKEQRKGAAKPMLWIGIASMAMAFAGLSSGYIVSRSALLERESWFVFELPSYFYVSTAVILLSSVTMIYALRQAKSGSTARSTQALILTLALGLAFAVLQILGWQELHENGVFFTGEGSNPAGSWVYAITFFHLLHMIAGVITLFITTIKSALGKYVQGNTLGIELTSIFWHFLDIVWIFLFTFLLFIR